jgi:hypothetical protein
MKKYNIDKCSQRENPGANDSEHCHPYSLLYNSLFHMNRYAPLNFCEIGIAEGRSLLAWEEYFPNSQIYGFEKYESFIQLWQQYHSEKINVHVEPMDVQIESNIIGAFQRSGAMFDCIIDDSSHYFFDMIRIIRAAIPFLKPGGMIIIEDIRKSFDESWFYNELKDVLPHFQSVYFVSLEHDRRNSGNVHNDKVLILVKNGPMIFNSIL